MKLRGLVPNSCIHVSESDFTHSQDRSAYLAAAKIDRLILGIYKSLTDTVHECGNWETEHYLCVGNNDADQFNFWEYIKRNQIFILDSHRPFTCSSWNFHALCRNDWQNVQLKVSRIFLQEMSAISFKTSEVMNKRLGDNNFVRELNFTNFKFIPPGFQSKLYRYYHNLLVKFLQ